MPLPDLCNFGGDWPTYEDEIYQVFLDTVVNGGLTFQGLPISCRFHPATNNKHFGFWHLISEGEIEEERTPDLRRCERMRWIAWMIANVGNDSALSWWENQRGRATHIVIWHEQESFAVILAKRNGYYLLMTCYLVRSKRANQFRKERAAFYGC